MIDGSNSRVNLAVLSRLAITAAAFWGLTGVPASATPVTFYFGGQITYVYDEFDVFEGRIDVGNSFFGSYTFELEQPDIVPADPDYSEYLGAVRAVSLEAGDIKFIPSISTSGTIVVANDRPISGRDFYQVRGPILFGTHGFNLHITLIDRDGTFVDSDVLLATPPSLQHSEIHAFGFGTQESGVSIGGDLQFLSVIPEPATIFLISCGWVVCGASRVACRIDACVSQRRAAMR